MRFSDAQIELYSRQIILRELGGTGQEKLLTARCVALGSGAALDAALSYLVGAGLGAIALLPLDGSPGEGRLAFAPLPGRNPDVRLRTLTSASEVALEDFEIALLVLPREARLADLALPAGRPRLGSIAVLGAADGALELALLPRDQACLACVDRAPCEAGVGDVLVAPDAARLGLAGSLAALAACRWIAGLDRDPQPRALRLPAHSALWVEAACARRPSCPRGCPVPAQSV